MQSNAGDRPKHVLTEKHPSTAGGQVTRERKELLAKLPGNSMEELYYRLLEDSPLGITVFDVDGNILIVNTAMVHILGSPSAETTMAINVLAFPPMVEAGISATLRQCLESGEKLTAEHFYRSKWGKNIYLRLHLNPLRDSANNITGAQMMVEDITRRKKDEQELQAHRHNLEKLVTRRTKEIADINSQLVLAEERFYKSFNANPVTISIIDLENGILMDANNSWLQIMDYKKEDVIGRKITEIMDLDNEDKLKAAVRNRGTIRNLEIFFRTRQGEQRTGLLSGDIITLDGKQCFLAVINDITDFQYMREEMARLERLHLVGEMAAGIAHEIRNPMTTVRGLVQMLKGKEECAPFDRYFTLMLDEMDRVNAIITEFLALAGNKKVELKKQNLNVIIEAIFPLIQADAISSGKYAEMNLKRIPPLLLNEKEFHQLVFNLARNGLEAMETGGRLSVTTWSEGPEVVLEIRDRGPGIAPEILQKIGTPFFSTKNEGTGLGLATCYSIAERHGATITIETGDDGTSFAVRFPVAE